MERGHPARNERFAFEILKVRYSYLTFFYKRGRQLFGYANLSIGTFLANGKAELLRTSSGKAAGLDIKELRNKIYHETSVVL
jgi:hypothetical protein